MKAILLDGYGTLVQIADKRHPFRQVGGEDKLQRRRFYNRALSANLTPQALLEPLGLDQSAQEAILEAILAETRSVQAYPDAQEFLARLDALGLPWLVVSNLAQPYCEPLINALGISPLRCRFSCVTGLIKPDPKAMLQPCADLSVAPSDVLMIGDSLRDDVGGAKAAGVNSFHLDRSQHTLWDALSLIDID